jgi:hypothetical protein
MNERILAQQSEGNTKSPSSGILQRKCACGQHTIAGGQCDACRGQQLGLPRRTINRTAQQPAALTSVHKNTVNEVEDSRSMPHPLKAGLEALSGIDFSGVRVHYGSAKPAQLNALAYTKGQDIYVSPGQEKHLPHEGWHVVQQIQGRVKPTLQTKSAWINDDTELEREADTMGMKALQVTQPALATTSLDHQRPASLDRNAETRKSNSGAQLVQRKEDVLEGINARSEKLWKRYQQVQRKLNKLSPDSEKYARLLHERDEIDKELSLLAQFTRPTANLWTPDESKYQSDYNRAKNYVDPYISIAHSTIADMILAYLKAKDKVESIMALRDSGSIWETITLILLSTAFSAIVGAKMILDRIDKIKEAASGYFAKGFEEAVKNVGKSVAKRMSVGWEGWSPNKPRVENAGVSVLDDISNANEVVKKEIIIKEEMFNGWQLAWDYSRGTPADTVMGLGNPRVPPWEYNLYELVKGKFEPRISLTVTDFQMPFERVLATVAIFRRVKAKHRIRNDFPMKAVHVVTFYKPTLSEEALNRLVQEYGWSKGQIGYLAMYGRGEYWGSHFFWNWHSHDVESPGDVDWPELWSRLSW